MRQLEVLSANAGFTAFRSTQIKAAWLAISRPDLLIDVSQISQVTADIYAEDSSAHIKRLKRTVRHAKASAYSITFPQLNIALLRIIGYFDAAFALNFLN